MWSSETMKINVSLMKMYKWSSIDCLQLKFDVCFWLYFQRGKVYIQPYDVYLKNIYTYFSINFLWANQGIVSSCKIFCLFAILFDTCLVYFAIVKYFNHMPMTLTFKYIN